MPSRTSAPHYAGFLALLLCLTATNLGSGATYTWNASGGSGKWDTSASNKVWSSSAGAVAWANGNYAYFPTDLAGGTATVDQAITVAGMTFYGDAYYDDYAVTSSSNTAMNTISLSSPSTVVSVNSSGSPFEVDVSAVLAGVGGGLNKQGDSMLSLDVNNTYSGRNDCFPRRA